MNFTLHQGDCLDTLKQYPDNHFDSIVTDPPYGISFMGKDWDYQLPSFAVWEECKRVLKPGGHLLSFSSARTYHRLAVSVEDAGFEIRDQIMWVYGSGFPKSHNIGKAVDKLLGNDREVVGQKTTNVGIKGNNYKSKSQSGTIEVTQGSSDWEGWGTALKPAHEPIVVARKPISEKTIAKNVLKWGTGGLNLDKSRVPCNDKSVFPNGDYTTDTTVGSIRPVNRQADTCPDGRFPANFIHDGLTEDWSRFFYCAKATAKERGQANNHPTVKPIKLMSYLINLVTPPGGVVLDPFMGSGSTGVAAVNCGFLFVGCELDPGYVEIAQHRIEDASVRCL